METILFDLDDTLIESMHVWEDAIIHLFKKMDLYMSMEEARQIFFTMKFSEVYFTSKKDFILNRMRLGCSMKYMKIF